MVRTLRADAHLLKGQARLAAHIFTLILRRNVHVSGRVIRNLCGNSRIVQPEEIKLHLGAKEEREAFLFCRFYGVCKDRACVHLKRPAVRVIHRAEHAHHAPVLGSPRQNAERRRVRAQDKVGVYLAAEARDGRRVDGNAVGKRAVQFVRHDRDVFEPAHHVAERHADELHILLNDILQNFFLFVNHIKQPFLKKRALIRTGTAPARMNAIAHSTISYNIKSNFITAFHMCHIIACRKTPVNRLCRRK